MNPIDPTLINKINTSTGFGSQTGYGLGGDPISLADPFGINPSYPSGGAQNTASSGGSGYGTQPSPAEIAAAKAKADTLAMYDDQMNQLRSLLGRTDTALTQGLTRNEDQYNTAVGGINTDKTKQEQSQQGAKQTAFDTINRNAGTGFRSLAQIIGRAAGIGSSAYQELLPHVIGSDTSAKRMTAANTYGTNISNIEDSASAALDDALTQKKQNEETLRTGIETQRQGINGQLAQAAAARAQANGGSYADGKAAAAPFQSAIDASRNAVEGFFDQFRTPYVTKPINPNLADYTVDRSAINASNNGEDPTNPYTAILRRRLQGAV